MKERIAVVCPGRGSYTKETLGILSRAEPKYIEFLNHLDELRLHQGLPTLSELDKATTFQTQLHTKGEHASALIYAASLIDFHSISSEQFEIVAITGNSMGWYTTLALAQALPSDHGFEVIQMMGAMMKDHLIGGQVIYPIVREDWTIDIERERVVFSILEDINSYRQGRVYLSIRLGGYVVLAGDANGIAQLLKALPKVDVFPFQLINHAAFHTPLLQDISNRAFESLSRDLFASPKIPMIDGRGHIWQPYSTDVDELYNYTLGHQVVAPYDFTKAIEVTIKEFAPNHIVLLGPGNSLGGALAQILIQHRWHGLRSKNDFIEAQKTRPYVLSFGIPEQRHRLQK